MPRSEVVVHLAYILMLIAPYGITESHGSALILSRRQALCESHSSRTQLGWADLVALERLRQRQRSRSACRRCPGGEVAVQHGCRRNTCTLFDSILSRDGALISAEEKQFVLFDRSADGSTELIALQKIRFRGEEVPAVEFVVA